MAEAAQEPKSEFDVSAGPTGVAVRTKGYRLMDIGMILMALAIVYIAVMLTMHEAGASEKQQQVVQVIKEQIQIQRETLHATREANCLNRLTPQERLRPENIEYCRQLGRGR